VAPTGPVLCLFNFADGWQGVSEAWARAQGVTRMWDALSDAGVVAQDGFVALPPQGRVWLM
jgi:amylosucrase